LRRSLRYPNAVDIDPAMGRIAAQATAGTAKFLEPFKELNKRLRPGSPV